MFSDALEHFKQHDPILYEAGRLIELTEIVPSTDLFRDVVWTITGQQLSSAAANTIFARFEALFPDGPFDPPGIVALDDTVLKAIGLSGAKVRAIRAFSETVRTGALTLSVLLHASDDEVRTALTSVKGIGPWTAEMVLMFSLGRPDVFSRGDLGLRKGMQELYHFRKPPSDERVESIVRRWSPYRTYASRLLWKIADAKKNRVVRTRPRAW